MQFKLFLLFRFIEMRHVRLYDKQENRLFLIVLETECVNSR